MKRFYFIILFIACISCGINKNTNIKCNENDEFKVVFDNHLEKLDFYYLGNWQVKTDSTLSFEEELDRLSVPKKDYRKALQFISNYTYVPFEDSLNYAEILPYGKYLQSNVQWQKWYIENRCNNIQFIE
jgi:hypothetical protein